MTVQGDGQIIRNPASAAGLLTARFQVVTPSQSIGSSGATYIRWDALPADGTWDDIGFDAAEYGAVGGRFYPSTDGEYLIVPYCQLNAQSAYTGGTAMIDIELGGGVDVGEKMTTPCSLDASTNLTVSGAHRRLVSAGDFFQIAIHQFGAGDTGIIGPASIWIGKVKSL